MTELNDLSSAQIEQSELTLKEFLQAEYPSLDLTRGTVFRDLLLRPAAAYHALMQTDMDRLRQSFSLKNIVEDPTLADGAIVDGVLSNLQITRDTGATATGQIRLVVSSLNTTPVSSNTVFTASSRTFTVDGAYIGVTTASNVTSSTTRLLQSRLDGNYEFLVDVTADDPGVESNIEAGTRFTVNPSIPRLVDAIAAGDFAGGLGEEDNAALAARAQLGISPQVLSGRSHIESLLRSNFPSLRSVSIIGFGDEEMRRDRHNLFGVSHGGKADLYVRTADFPQTISVDVTAVLIDKTAGTWQTTLTRDTAAGVYRVVGVYVSGASPAAQLDGSLLFLDSLAILSHTRQLDLASADGEFVPDITDVSEGAFSRYQTLTVQFTDLTTAASTDAMGSAEFTAYVYQMPDIAALQSFVNDRSRRNPCADYLVRAAIPCICTSTINVVRRSVDTQIDSASIQLAASAAINNLGFQLGYLPGAKIVVAAHSLLDSSATLDLPVSLSGRLWCPDDTAHYLGASDELSVPDGLESLSVTSRTVGFYLTPKDVVVNVSGMGTPEV